MKSTTNELEQLIHSVAQNECQLSFKKLFLILHPKLYSYSLQVGLDKPQALELCQEVMLKVWRKAKTFDSSKGDLKSWVFTIARNSRFDFLRKKRNDPLSLSSKDIYQWQESELLAIDGPSMEELYQNAEVLSKVNQLPEDQKKVIQSIYGEGKTHVEYSQSENIPLGTVKSRIRLAISSLKKEMNK